MALGTIAPRRRILQYISILLPVTLGFSTAESHSVRATIVYPQLVKRTKGAKDWVWYLFPESLKRGILNLIYGESSGFPVTIYCSVEGLGRRRSTRFW